MSNVPEPASCGHNHVPGSRAGRACRLRHLRDTTRHPSVADLASALLHLDRATRKMLATLPEVTTYQKPTPDEREAVRMDLDEVLANLEATKALLGGAE